jgi:hypothetical protein
MGYSYCTYTLTIIRYGTNEIKEYSIKGDVYKTICLEGDDYSLEEDIAKYKNKTFCKDGVWSCSGGVKRDYEYICQKQNIPFNTVLDVTMSLSGEYY